MGGGGGEGGGGGGGAAVERGENMFMFNPASNTAGRGMSLGLI